MKASDVMSTPVIGVRPDAPLSDVARTLVEGRISAVPVMDGERLVGILSEADVLRARPADAPRLARDVMTRAVATVGADTPLEDVASLLAARGIRRVPVMQGSRVVGIVSRANLVHALAVRPLGAVAPGEADAAVRVAVLERLGGEPWWRGESREDEPDRPAPAFGIRRARDRGHARHGWADTYYSFSFGDFHDPAYMRYGALQAINETVVQPGRGSTTFGVRDVEIITYVLAGALGHESSLEEQATIGAGGVQCVSAGSGLRFSEVNVGGEPARYLQIWLDPDRAGLPASYAHKRFSATAKRGRLQAIASGDGRDGSLRVRQDAAIYAGLFNGPAVARLELAAGRRAYVHVANGALTVQGEALGAGDGLAAEPAAPLRLEHGSDAEVLVFDLPGAGGG